MQGEKITIILLITGRILLQFGSILNALNIYSAWIMLTVKHILWLLNNLNTFTTWVLLKCLYYRKTEKKNFKRLARLLKFYVNWNIIIFKTKSFLTLLKIISPKEQNLITAYYPLGSRNLAAHLASLEEV